jgi:hypothetical protein
MVSTQPHRDWAARPGPDRREDTRRRPAQRHEGGLEQRVPALGQCPGGRVQRVDRALLDGRLHPTGGLDRAGQPGVLALVAQIGQHRVLGVGPVGERVEQSGMGAGAGGVVLAARSDRRRPQRPAIRGGDDLHVPAVAGVLSRPPEIHSGGRTDGFGPVGADHGAVEVHVGVSGHPRGEQRTVQRRRGRGEDVDPLVQVAVGGGAAELVVGCELRDPGAVEEPAQHQHSVAVAAQHASALPRPASGAFTSENAGQERDGGLPDREHGGVADRIGHAGPRQESIFGRTASSTEVPHPT